MQTSESNKRRKARIFTAAGKGLVLGLLLAALTGTLAASRAEAQIRCGDTIAPGTQMVLLADVTCDDEDTGIVVIGPAVLDLNGFAVRCADQNGNGFETITGIALEGSGATVRGGAVRGCRQGIGVGGAGRHAVANVSVLFSASTGMRIDSDRNVVTDSFAFFNGGTGFSVAGKANVLSGNAATGNRAGFEVEQRNTLQRNIASGSERTGFVVRGRQAKLTGNRAVGGSIGFEITGTSNRLTDNESADNSTGFFLEGRSKRNKLTGNVATGSGINGFAVDGLGHKLMKSRAEGNSGNGIRVASTASRISVRSSSARNNDQADLFDNTPGCGTNRWRNNAFGSRNDACIE